MQNRSLSVPVALCTLWLSACHSSQVEPDPQLLADLAVMEDLASPSVDATLPPPTPSVACGAMLPGPPLKSDVTEALPDYAAQLAALDLKTVPRSA